MYVAQLDVHVGDTGCGCGDGEGGGSDEGDGCSDGEDDKEGPGLGNAEPTQQTSAPFLPSPLPSGSMPPSSANSLQGMALLQAADMEEEEEEEGRRQAEVEGRWLSMVATMRGDC